MPNFNYLCDYYMQNHKQRISVWQIYSWDVVVEPDFDNCVDLVATGDSTQTFAEISCVVSLNLPAGILTSTLITTDWQLSNNGLDDVSDNRAVLVVTARLTDTKSTPVIDIWCAECWDADSARVRSGSRTIKWRAVTIERSIKLSATLEAKLKQNSFKSVLKLFWNCFVSVSFQVCGQLYTAPPSWWCT